MPTAPRLWRLARFGDYEVDLEAGELRKHGLRIKLQYQPFQILTLLLDRPGRLVSREELQRLLWPNDTVVEFEHGINAAINRLREALSDSAEEPRYVETLPRRGYRFIAPVDTVAAVYGRRPEAAGRRPALQRLVVALSAVAVVALVIAAWLWFNRSRPTRPEEPMTAIPLTSYPGSEDSPSFSPDATQIAFAWNGEKEDNWDIYVKAIGSEPPLRLTTNPARDFSPAWSPDGRWIAFGRDLPGRKYAVVLIPPTGGPERVLTELNSPGFDAPPPYLAWSPDSRSLAMVVGGQSVEQHPAALFLYSLASGESRRLTSPPANMRGDDSPAFSPDGRTLAFSRGITYASTDLYVLGLSEEHRPDGHPRRITGGNWEVLCPAWTADGRALIISTILGPDASLWRVDASGKNGRVKVALNYNNPFPSYYRSTISVRGNRLAYVQSIADVDIWRMELPTPGRKSRPPRKLISSTRMDVCPQISPDGKKIAFLSDRSGSWQIWVCNSDGSNLLQVTSLGKADLTEPRWSPDGSHLTFAANPEGRYEIFLIGPDGRNLKRLSPDARGADNPSWSRDGRWIFFDGLPNTGIYKVPVEGEPAVRVTSQYWGPVEAPKDDSIYAMEVTPTGQDLWRIPTKGGMARKVLDSLPDHLNYWLVEGGIYFIPRPDPKSGYSLQYRDTATGKIKQITTFEKPVRHISVSPDRRWIVYGQFNQLGSDLMLVEDFH
jgi:Tol biopolymer transport system component/DNA-binding winged helix-turn-helix (wHTH) protein